MAETEHAIARMKTNARVDFISGSSGRHCIQSTRIFDMAVGTTKTLPN
jgi:hypothetical protein